MRNHQGPNRSTSCCPSTPMYRRSASICKTFQNAFPMSHADPILVLQPHQPHSAPTYAGIAYLEPTLLMSMSFQNTSFQLWDNISTSEILSSDTENDPAISSFTLHIQYQSYLVYFFQKWVIFIRVHFSLSEYLQEILISINIYLACGLHLKSRPE